MKRPKVVNGISRRGFLKAGAATAAAAASSVYPTFYVKGQDTAGQLRLLQWSHFVPQYDKWFDPFAKAWGDANGVEVIVDHIGVGDIPAAAAAEIAAGEGHDMIEFIFPPSSYEPSVLDLTDVNLEADSLLGQRIELTRHATFNPTTNKYFAFCHSWVPDPGDYRVSLWSAVDMPDGPATWQDLLEGGSRIRDELGVQLGIGMSNELDSRMACRAILWAYGASVQDASENVVINSPETIAALEYMKQLYEGAMTPEVFSWTPASNNQLLIAGQASYILNSISAYRTAQEVNVEVADDISFLAPLVGPAGAENSLVSEHAITNYVVPTHAANPGAAQDFLLHLVINTPQIVFNSKLYNFPTYMGTTPELLADGGWLDQDPFGSRPADKLSGLKNAEAFSTVIGHPGPSNPAVGEVFGTSLVPQMFAKVARGEMSAEDAAAEAEELIQPIFERWTEEGLVGGAS